MGLNCAYSHSHVQPLEDWQWQAGITKIDFHVSFLTLKSIDRLFIFSYFACLYHLTLFGFCHHLCISLFNSESSLTIIEIESVLEAIVSNLIFSLLNLLWVYFSNSIWNCAEFCVVQKILCNFVWNYSTFKEHCGWTEPVFIEIVPYWIQSGPPIWVIF